MHRGSSERRFANIAKRLLVLFGIGSKGSLRHVVYKGERWLNVGKNLMSCRRDKRREAIFSEPLSSHNLRRNSTAFLLIAFWSSALFLNQAVTVTQYRLETVHQEVPVWKRPICVICFSFRQFWRMSPWRRRRGADWFEVSLQLLAVTDVERNGSPGSFECDAAESSAAAVQGAAGAASLTLKHFRIFISGLGVESE